MSYAAWRDTKTAIFVFNRGTATSTVLTGVKDTTEAHKNFEANPELDARKRLPVFVLGHPNDTNRELILTLLVFDIPKP